MKYAMYQKKIHLRRSHLPFGSYINGKITINLVTSEMLLNHLQVLLGICVLSAFCIVWGWCEVCRLAGERAGKTGSTFPPSDTECEHALPVVCISSFIRENKKKWKYVNRRVGRICEQFFSIIFSKVKGGSLSQQKIQSTSSQPESLDCTGPPAGRGPPVRGERGDHKPQNPPKS